MACGHQKAQVQIQFYLQELTEKVRLIKINLLILPARTLFPPTKISRLQIEILALTLNYQYTAHSSQKANQ